MIHNIATIVLLGIYVIPGILKIFEALPNYHFIHFGSFGHISSVEVCIPNYYMQIQDSNKLNILCKLLSIKVLRH